MRNLAISQIELGEKLNECCPQNDCGIYKNLFNMHQALKADIEKIVGTVSTFAVAAVEQELSKVIGRLDGMYFENYAVQQYKKEIAGKAN